MAGVADTLKTQLLEQWARLDPAYIQSVLNQSGLTLDQLATEFADQAQQAGITDLSALNTGTTVEKVAADDGSYDVVRNYLTAGDKDIGYIGDGDQRQYLDDPDALNRVLYPYAFKDTDPNQLGRVFGTAEGEGWTAGDVVRAPSGELLIVPSWGDSSDKRSIYKAVSALAAPIGGALTGPLSSALTPTLGATGANIATGAIIGSGTSALTGGNTEDILTGAVVGGLAGGVKDYLGGTLTDTATNTPSIDSAIAKLEDAYKAADLPVDYAAIERSLLAQGFNPIGTRAVIDIARSTGTVADTATTSSQVVDIVGSKLADTSVLEALNLVPVGTFTSSATTATTTPTTVTQGTTTPTTTEQTVEVTAPTTPSTPAVVVPPVVTQPPAAVTTTPGTTEQTVTVTSPRDLATAADVSALYNSLLGRAPDAAGLDFYSKNGFTIDEVRNDMLNSDEYRSRTATNPPTVNDQTVNISGTRQGTVAVGTPGSTLVQSTTPVRLSDVTIKGDGTTTEDGDDAGAGTGAVTGGTTGNTGGTGGNTDINSDIDNTNLVDDGDGVTLPSWLTTDFLNALITLGVFSGGGTGGTGPGGTGTVSPGSLPTQGVPTPTTDYYNQVQQYYNQYMPTQPRDVATPLQTWYGGSLFNTPTNIPASPTTTTTGGMTLNIDTQAIIDFLNQYVNQQD